MGDCIKAGIGLVLMAAVAAAALFLWTALRSDYPRDSEPATSMCRQPSAAPMGCSTASALR